ncbi:MAG TPA: hypothetical protein VGA53_00025 [Candidatus Paceibacterota bacterium]
MPRRLNPDEKWGRFNEKLYNFSQENDFLGLGTTYYEMAEFLKKEGKDNSKMRRLGYEMKLQFHSAELRRNASSDVVQKVEILATTDSCKACKNLNDKAFTVGEAQEKNPIPVEECIHKYGCRCVYLPVVE